VYARKNGFAAEVRNVNVGRELKAETL